MKNSRKLLFTLIASLFALHSEGAVTVNVISNSNTGNYLDLNGGLLTNSSVYSYGFLDETAYDGLSVAEQLDYTSVSNVFSELGNGVIPTSGEIFSSGNSHSIPTPPTEPQPGSNLYMWVFNDPTASSATAWGLFGSSSWVMPNDQGTVSLTSSLIDNIVFGSSSGDDFKLQAVPEPSAYATILGFLGLGYAIFCRRRRSSSRE